MGWSVSTVLFAPSCDGADLWATLSGWPALRHPLADPHPSARRAQQERRVVAIYGAGTAGIQLHESLHTSTTIK